MPDTKPSSDEKLVLPLRFVLGLSKHFEFDSVVQIASCRNDKSLSDSEMRYIGQQIDRIITNCGVGE